MAWKLDNSLIEDRHALDGNVSGHEFRHLLAKDGETADEYMPRCLASRLRAGAIAEKLGYSGIRGKTVVDIGCNRGRYLQMLRDLGAKEVYGIDPYQEAIAEAIDKYRLDIAHALNIPVEGLPDQFNQFFDTAFLFNPDIPAANLEAFFKKLDSILKSKGELVVTFAEKVREEMYKDPLSEYFDYKGPIKLFEGSGVHQSIIIARKLK